MGTTLRLFIISQVLQALDMNFILVRYIATLYTMSFGHI